MTNSVRWGSSRKLAPRQLELPSRLESVQEAARELAAYLAPLKLDEQIQFDLRLALSEAVANAIRYGNKLQPHQPVRLGFALSGGAVRIQVRDVGPGFDYRRLPDPTAPENLLKGSGRGVFLIHQFMDDVRFNARGNEITMVKHVRSGHGDQARTQR